LPLATSALIAVVSRPWRNASAVVSVASSFLCFFIAAWGVHTQSHAPSPVQWITAGDFSISIGMVLDGLSKTMLLTVTGVGALIHLFSMGYMKEDNGKSRYFACLSLFMFSMTGIVLSSNLIMTFLFWELVGFSSYLLIGFWFERPSAAAAANKAFIVNRIGDFGFMIGILMAWHWLGSIEFAQLEGALNDGRGAHVPGIILVLMTLGLFCGAAGKSAQVPLHVWLPDAMEGPTPVSALIHAATMVAAGVYFLCRVFFLISLSPATMNVIAFIGGGTALFAALIAVQQNDIKRVLAYSTLSQLGYMMMAVGLAAPGAAMFHLTTHAFFKALLFLGAGSVIHAMHHEQNIWKMGGLKDKMPITCWTFVAGMLALSGCPFLSGFFSKDAILSAALEKNHFLFALGLGTAFLTAFYMTRLTVTVFFGKEKTKSASHAHEAEATMWVPLCILAAFSVVAGWGGAIPDMLAISSGENHGHIVPALSAVVFLAGIWLGFYFYRGKKTEPFSVSLLANKFYVDEIYGATFVRGHDKLGEACRLFDRWVISGLLVRGTGLVVSGTGHLIRFMHSGNLQGYAFLFVIGIVFVLYQYLIR